MTDPAPPDPVSVVVPVYGHWDFVRALVDDLSRCDDIAEIVLVDDAHPEPPPAVDSWHPAVRVVRRERNGGFAAAVNTGIDQAQYPLIVLLNADLRISPAAFGGLVARLRKRPAAIHGPLIDSGDGPTVEQRRPFPTRRTLLLEFCLPLRLAPSLDTRLRGLPSGPAPDAPAMPVDWLSGACLAFARSTFDALGPLDERFGMYIEDAEWQLRAAAAGVERLLHGDLHVDHELSHGAFADQARLDDRYVAAWTASLTLLDMRGQAGLDTRALLVATALLDTPFVVVRQAAAALGRTRRGPSLRAYWRVPFLPVKRRPVGDAKP